VEYIAALFRAETYAEQETSVKAGGSACLFFDPKNGGDMFLRNVGWFSTDYTAFISHRCENLKPYISENCFAIM
jgi:hypothetical protein